MNDRQIRFLNAAKGLPEYTGWNDDEIYGNINEVLNSGDQTRAMKLSSALKNIPEYGGWDEVEILGNITEVFPINQTETPQYKPPDFAQQIQQSGASLEPQSQPQQYSAPVSANFQSEQPSTTGISPDYQQFEKDQIANKSLPGGILTSPKALAVGSADILEATGYATDYITRKSQKSLSKSRPMQLSKRQLKLGMLEKTKTTDVDPMMAKIATKVSKQIPEEWKKEVAAVSGQGITFERTMKDPAGVLNTIFTQAANTAPLIAEQAVISSIGAIALPGFGAVVGGGAAMMMTEMGNFLKSADVMKEGLSEPQKKQWQDIVDKYAPAYGIASGMTEYAGNATGVLGAAKDIGKKLILKDLFKRVAGIIGEGVEELSQTALMNTLMGKAIEDMKQENPDFAPDWKPDSKWDAFKSGVAVSALFSGTSTIAQKMVEPSSVEPLDKKVLPDAQPQTDLTADIDRINAENAELRNIAAQQPERGVAPNVQKQPLKPEEPAAVPKQPEVPVPQEKGRGIKPEPETDMMPNTQKFIDKKRGISQESVGVEKDEAPSEIPPKYTPKAQVPENILNPIIDFDKDISEEQNVEKRQRLEKAKRRMADPIVDGVYKNEDAWDVAKYCEKNNIPCAIIRGDGRELKAWNKKNKTIHAETDAEIKQIWGDIYSKRIREAGGIMSREQGDEFLIALPGYTKSEATDFMESVEKEAEIVVKKLGLDAVPSAKAEFDGLPVGTGIIDFGVTDLAKGKYGETDRTADQNLAERKITKLVDKAKENGYIVNVDESGTVIGFKKGGKDESGKATEKIGMGKKLGRESGISDESKGSIDSGTSKTNTENVAGIKAEAAEITPIEKEKPVQPAEEKKEPASEKPATKTPMESAIAEAEKAIGELEEWGLNAPNVEKQPKIRNAIIKIAKKYGVKRTELEDNTIWKSKKESIVEKKSTDVEKAPVEQEKPAQKATEKKEQREEKESPNIEDKKNILSDPEANLSGDIQKDMEYSSKYLRSLGITEHPYDVSFNQLTSLPNSKSRRDFVNNQKKELEKSIEKRIEEGIDTRYQYKIDDVTNWLKRTKKTISNMEKISSDIGGFMTPELQKKLNVIDNKIKDIENYKLEKESEKIAIEKEKEDIATNKDPNIRFSGKPGSPGVLTELPKSSVSQILPNGSNLITGTKGEITDGRILFVKKYIPDSFKKRFDLLVSKSKDGDTRIDADIEKVIPSGKELDMEYKFSVNINTSKIGQSLYKTENDKIIVIDSNYIAYLNKEFPNHKLIATETGMKGILLFPLEKRAVKIYDGKKFVGLVMPYRYSDVFDGIDWSIEVKPKSSKEDNSKDAAFSKQLSESSESNPITFDDAKEIVKAKIPKALWDKSIVRLHKTPGKTQGAIYVDGNTLMVDISPDTPSNRLVDVIFHDIMGHAGAANVLKSNPKIHKRLKALYGTSTAKIQRKTILKNYKEEFDKKRKAGKSEQDIENELFAEWIAHNVERYNRTKEKTGLPYQIWKAIKEFLIGLGWKKDSITDAMETLVAAIRKTTSFEATIGTERGGAFSKEGPMFAKEQAPVDPFFSPTLRAVENLKQERGTGDQMFNMITKTPGVKEAEWKWMGLDDFLKGKPSVTKQEIEEFVRQNQVEIKEVKKGGKERRDLKIERSWKPYLFNVVDSDGNIIKENVSQTTASETVDTYWEGKGDTKFSQYTLPGGDNYREVLLTLPREKEVADKTPKQRVEQKSTGKVITYEGYKPGTSLEANIIDWENSGWGERNQDFPGGGRKYRASFQNKDKNFDTEQEAIDWAKREQAIVLQKIANQDINRGKDYRSSHWDEPNVIAHVRMNDRTGPNGEKVLFVEEIQSDWAREAREKGVKGEELRYGSRVEGHVPQGYEFKKITRPNVSYVVYQLIKSDTGEVVSEGSDKIDALKKAKIDPMGGVPAQPFLKNWEELTLKRVLRMAAEEGYDRVAWINGEQTAARYDLSKQVDEIRYVPYEGKPGQYEVEVFKDGVPLATFAGTPEELKGSIGKDVVEKIQNDEGIGDEALGDWKALQGESLKIGGTWATALYDRMIPKFLEKYGKKFGVKVENVGLGGKIKWNVEFEDRPPIPYDTELEAKKAMNQLDGVRITKEAGLAEQMSVPITEQMRQSVMYEGQPMFAKELQLDPTGIPIESTMDKIRQKVQDRFLRLERLQNALNPNISEEMDARLAQELYNGRAEARLDEFERKHFKPLREKIVASKIKIDELEDFLYAQHAAERNEHIKNIRPKETEGFLTEQEMDLLNRANEIGYKKAGEPDALKVEKYDRQLEDIVSKLKNLNVKKEKIIYTIAGSGMFTTKADKDAAIETYSNLGNEDLLEEIKDMPVAEEILNKFKDAGKTGKLESLASDVYDITDRVRNVLLAEGLIDEETKKAWESYEFYVPLRGLKDEKQTPRTGRGFDIRGKESKRALGRKSKAENILANIIVQANEAVIRAEKNRVGRAFLNFIQANPNEELWTIDESKKMAFFNERTGEVEYRIDPKYRLADNIMSVKVDGKEYHITINDDTLAKAMVNLGAEKSNKVLQGLSMLNRYFALINTSLVPEFVLTNLSRDLQTAMINSGSEYDVKTAGRILKTVPSAIKWVWEGESNKDSEGAKWYNEYKQSGGKIGFFGLESVDDVSAKLKSELSLMEGGTKENFIKGARAATSFIMKANGAIENASRLATYVEMRKNGLSKAKAASIARNITVDFNKSGELGQYFKALFVFSNASIQGTTRTLKALKNPRTQAVAAGIVAGSIALAELGRLVGGKDDDDEYFYDKIPGFIKQNNIVFMTTKGEVYFKIPVPYGFNIFHAFGQSLDYVIHNNKKGDFLKAASNVAGAVGNSFNPLGSASNILQMLTPTSARPITDISLNKNFMGGPVYKVDKYGIPKAQSSTHFKGTSVPAKGIAKGLNIATGGGEYERGIVDLPPDVIDYVFDFYTGGLGKTVKNAISLPLKIGTKKDITTNEIPFVRRFVGEISEYQDINTFYENVNRAETIRKEYEAKKLDNPTSAVKYYDKNKDILLLTTKLPIGKNRQETTPINNMEKKIKDLRKIKDALENAGKLNLAKEYEEKILSEIKMYNRTLNKVGR